MKLGITAFLTDETIMPDRLATEVEDRGFASLFLSEHSNIPASRRTPYPETPDGVLPHGLYRLMDPFIALTAAAMSATSITLGTAVTLIAQCLPRQRDRDVGRPVGWPARDRCGRGLEHRRA
jgi:alkanesulfonate monooxygenase SsuD/methylene tetrahydromethanopterin reductase-like flavin-dependent oxidoreductase (luciferase family)